MQAATPQLELVSSDNTARLLEGHWQTPLIHWTYPVRIIAFGHRIPLQSAFVLQVFYLVPYSVYLYTIMYIIDIYTFVDDEEDEDNWEVENISFV